MHELRHLDEVAVEVLMAEAPLALLEDAASGIVRDRRELRAKEAGAAVAHYTFTPLRATDPEAAARPVELARGARKARRGPPR